MNSIKAPLRIGPDALEVSASYLHHQIGTAERANRTIRERASAMIQDENPRNLGEQISRIITLRGSEFLQNAKIPEKLWPEAIRHAVWLKNRTPTKAHKYKITPFEKVEGVTPALDRERIWGSRAFISLTEEERLAKRHSKLHGLRGLLGYFVGCESESIYRI